MGKLGRRLTIGLSIVFTVLFGLWFFLPYVIGAWIGLVCSEPLTDPCKADIRMLGHAFALSKNYEAAARWYEWAATENDVEAMFYLGSINEMLMTQSLRVAAKDAVEHRTSLYVPPGFGAHGVKASQWYQEAAWLGFAPAMNNLGECYRTGVGVDADPRLSFRWHLAAAKAGNPVGAINAADDYRRGFGTRVDAREALRWEKFDLKSTDPRDLIEPTLALTRALSGMIPFRYREAIRLAAERQVPLDVRAVTIIDDSTRYIYPVPN